MASIYPRYTRSDVFTSIRIIRSAIAVFKKTHIPQHCLHPTLALLCEHRLQITVENLPGILQILLGVGFGGGDTVKGFVENGDDALLLGKRNWIKEFNR